MRHYIEKLTHTSALRLYRLPQASQLLRRLGPEWHVPSPEDLPLAVPVSRTGPGRRRHRPTVLEALAARIPSDGPRVDVVAIPPWEVPNWTTRLTYMGVIPAPARLAWTQDLTRSFEGMSIAVIHIAAKIANTEREDGLTVGGAAATFSVGASAWTGLAWTYGEGVTQFDADAFSVAKMAQALAMFYTEDRPPPDNVFILCPSAPALQAVKNPRSKTAHSHALMFHQSLTSLCLRHRNTEFFLVWTPVDDELEGQNIARDMAREACLQDPPEGLHRIQSAAYQKDRARARAFASWELEWRGERAKHALQLEATGRSTESAAYTHAIRRPPDGRNHPLWAAAVKKKKDDNGNKTKVPLYSRRTTSIALQLAVDHAFTGTYVTRFRPGDPAEASHCPCGNLLRSANT
jgi:hypothetical protein